jgi:hypothetical protein
LTHPEHVYAHTHAHRDDRGRHKRGNQVGFAVPAAFFRLLAAAAVFVIIVGHMAGVGRAGIRFVLHLSDNKPIAPGPR